MDAEPIPAQTDPVVDAAPPARVRRGWPRWLPRALFESILIVFSVLLALALNEWRDHLRTQSRVRSASDAVVAELRNNRAAAARAAATHRDVHQRLSAYAARQEVPSLRVAGSGSFNPANVVETAWTSARDADVLDEWPYELTLTVSRVYERQAAYSTLSQQIAADIYMDIRRRGVGPVLQEGYGGFIALAHDFATREEELVRQYDTALAAIGRVHQ